MPAEVARSLGTTVPATKRRALEVARLTPEEQRFSLSHWAAGRVGCQARLAASRVKYIGPHAHIPVGCHRPPVEAQDNPG